MDSERTACWPRHKRRVYAQAEGFENPQRTHYRRLMNFLAKNSGLCQKAILNTARVPEFAAVRTILNRKLKETEPNPEVDLLARELLKETAIQEAAHLGDIADLTTLDSMDAGELLDRLQAPEAFFNEEQGLEQLQAQEQAQEQIRAEAEASAVGDLFGIIHDDSQEVEAMLTGERRPWDDLSDLLQDMSPVNDLLREDSAGYDNPGDDRVDSATEDLFHGKPNTRGRFGRRRVSRSLSSLVIEHVLKNTEEEQDLYEGIEVLNNDPYSNADPISELGTDSTTDIGTGPITDAGTGSTTAVDTKVGHQSKQEETTTIGGTDTDKAEPTDRDRSHAYELWYQTVSNDLKSRAETRASSKSNLPSGSQIQPSIATSPDLGFAATPDPVADPNNFATTSARAAESTEVADFTSPLASPSDRTDFSQLLAAPTGQENAFNLQEAKERRIATAPLSRTEAMLEKWFRALDDRMHSVSLLEESTEEEEESDYCADDETTTGISIAYASQPEPVNKYGSYADELADNPAELLKQLEKIARGSDADILDLKRKNRGSFIKQSPQPCLLPLSKGKRKEVYPNGAVVVKDSVGKVLAVRSGDKVSITFTYDGSGNLIAFSRYNADGSLHTYGERDHHGVVVRDPCGRVRAQGESMTCDPRGCLTIRKMDGQFWCVDLVRNIHIERRILEDLDGNWSSLTALLTYDGFRMATRFQELKDSYRRYGDWLAQSNASTFRFYGRDGSMIQFDSDEELQSLRPSSIKPPGTKEVDEELKGRRKARTAWDSVHEYVSQYLAVL